MTGGHLPPLQLLHHEQLGKNTRGSSLYVNVRRQQEKLRYWNARHVLLEVACVVGSTRDLACVHMETGQQHHHFLCLRPSERSKPSSPELHEENTAALNNSPCKELYPTNTVHIMPDTKVPLDSRHRDLNFIPAYISAVLCAQYVLARHPQVTFPIIFCISFTNPTRP